MEDQYINLTQRGTLAVMEWLALNNTPTLKCQVFAQNGDRFLMVSSESEQDMWARLQVNPLETWDDVKGHKRLAIRFGSEEANEPAFFFHINGRFYFATLYH